MKASEFYEKYWKIKDAQGNWVSPPKLSEEEKEFLNQCAARDSKTFALFIRARRRPVQVDVELMKQEMEKFPKYFFPTIQPLLDKYGNITNPEDTI